MKIKNRILHLFCFVLLSSVGLFAQHQKEESKTSPLMMFRMEEAKKEHALVADPDLRSNRAQDEVANEASREAGASQQEKIAEVLGNAASYYGYALGNEKEGKVVEYYTQTGRACERQAEALVSNNDVEVILQKEMAEAL